MLCDLFQSELWKEPMVSAGAVLDRTRITIQPASWTRSFCSQGGSRSRVAEETLTCVLDYQSDPNQQVLVDKCGTGFHPACDVLSQTIDSEEEALAVSCGSRTDYTADRPPWPLF